MANHFASLLRKLRLENGFRSGYAFYHDNGGRRVFPFTYTYYAKIEQGKALPRSSWLPILLSSLRMPPSAANYREFVLAYLRDVFGNDSLFDDMVIPWLKPADPVPVQKKTVRRLIGNLTRNMSPEEFNAVVSSPASMWCFLCLTKSREPMSEEQLAERTDLPLPQVKAGLRALAARKLVKRSPDRRYLSPMRNQYNIFPRIPGKCDPPMEKLVDYIEEAYRRKGSEIVNRRAVVRAEESDMIGVAQSLNEDIDTALGCAVEESGQKTSLFVVESRLRRLFPF
jgi:hypothetical protein